MPALRSLLLASALLACLAMAGVVAPGPRVGDEAKEFTLKTLTGEQVTLSEAVKKGPVVLVVLRGYPGYQCPVCTKQVGELLASADAFAQANATVILVYPGPAADLDQRAAEFIKGKQFPQHFRFVTDPGYTFTDAWGLRWDEPNETAYPSSFVIGQDRIITHAVVSQSHEGRPETAELVQAARKAKAAAEAAAKDRGDRVDDTRR